MKCTIFILLVLNYNLVLAQYTFPKKEIIQSHKVKSIEIIHHPLLPILAEDSEIKDIEDIDPELALVVEIEDDSQGLDAAHNSEVSDINAAVDEGENIDGGSLADETAIAENLLDHSQN